MVLTTVLVRVSITDMPPPVLATYAMVPAELTATPRGYWPTLIVSITWPVTVLITDTEAPRPLVT
jgi:hypothetical protein